MSLSTMSGSDRCSAVLGWKLWRRPRQAYLAALHLLQAQFVLSHPTTTVWPPVDMQGVPFEPPLMLHDSGSDGTEARDTHPF